MERTKRVLLTKIGLDGHDRGLKILAKKLSQAGIEIIYLGLFQTVESIAETATQEDVDFIGVSVMDGGQILIAEDLKEALKKKEISHVGLIFGGIIPERDRSILENMGVKAVFGPGTPIPEIIKTIRNA